MEKFIYVFILVLILLALPYFYQIYKLKTISINDIPDSGSWVESAEAIFTLSGLFRMQIKKLKGPWY